MDTIYALATAPGKAGVAVMRLSGPCAMEVAEQLVGPLPVHGRSLRQIVDLTGGVIDRALVLSFAKGRSFTGEEIVEFHLHGSRAVIAAVIAVFAQLPQLRLADPGEFTRRAFENGRLDLSQVEGLADLIDAETEGQRRQALRILSGALAQRTESWRSRLLRAVALVEATIDFADEDVPQNVWPEVQSLLGDVAGELSAEVAGAKVAERVREGFEVAIVGSPNAGKSTLLNYLAGREAAITSEIAGTTRDVIEVRMDLNGLPVTFLDTAGLREASDQIEQIGIERAISRATAADIRIHLVLPDETPFLEVASSDIVVLAKVDLFGGTGKMEGVSGKTGQGVERVTNAVSVLLQQRVAGIGLAVRERHRVAMVRAFTGLTTAVNLMKSDRAQAELVALELGAAIRVLDGLVGRMDIEDVLGEVFARFCIGK